MHSELASISFSIIYGEPVTISKSSEPLQIGKFTIIPKEARDIHKSVTFSKFYKGGPSRVYQILAKYINQAQPAAKRMTIAKKISEALDHALPMLSKYLSKLIDEANYRGYLVTTKLGRRRYFDGKVYGEAANAPIQGSNADAMKIALVNIYKNLGDKGRICLTVHDEVMCIVKKEYSKEMAEMIKAEMARSLTWMLNELKGGSSVKIKSHWEK
jgi:DNA polymerase I-like protein with 3'-5' exonuclease and polymerase domains